MYFDRAHLDEFQQAFFILDVEILVTLAFVLELERMNVRSEAFARIALIEALSINAGRASQQTKRMPAYPRQQERRDSRVVFRQVALGDVANFGE